MCHRFIFRKFNFNNSQHVHVQIEYYIESDVDVEGITSKSSPFYIYLYGDTASLFVIHLPLHLRYHSPGDSGYVKKNIHPCTNKVVLYFSFVKVSLENPEVSANV